ncbi:MAG TPA: DUF4038 domain-containing protein, partial [Lacipirellulaceae bacterium]|nr:DUF4038 domain-containing protein [Lacipirellulaceae bacterium]
RGRIFILADTEIAADGRTFQYADGEPLLLMGDTLWAGNSARCGLGDDRDGPFYEYLADRKSKGFNAVLMRYINGFGDEQHNPLGHRNEGGRLFEDRGQDRSNPDYFRSLDQRVAALADYGFVAGGPLSWGGKTRGCPIEFDLATQLSAYCAVRYAAYNTIWALSGEYQYAFQDCGWTPEQFDQLGATLQQHNAYRRPTSIHPSSRTDFDPPHNGQSSRAYHRSPWLDHHWLQTGQRVSSLRNIPLRAAEVRDLSPVRPVFCSEGFYESADDQDGAYHARWQVWQAVLAGCAGYGYGAHGVWQFFDPHDPDGETGKPVAGSVPWRQALQLPGASQVRHALTLLSDLPWPETTPCTERLRVDGAPVARPTSSDLSPPVAAAMGTDDYVLYLPRGNGAADIELMAHHSDGAYHAEWFDPRTADRITCGQVVVDRGRLRVPSRPTPGDEDWVLWLRAADDTQLPVGIDR